MCSLQMKSYLPAGSGSSKAQLSVVGTNPPPPSYGVYRVPHDVLANMLAGLKRVGYGQYIAEASVGDDRYVVTAGAPMPLSARVLWAALVDELRERSVGSLVQICINMQGVDEAIAALQGILIYRYFPNGFDLMTPLMQIRKLPDRRVQVEFDARLIDALRADGYKS